MPAYNFKEQFADAVASKAKRSTIRPPRQRPTRPGDTLYLYTGQRTKACRQLATGICATVRSVVIDETGIVIEGRRIPKKQAERLAKGDGFEQFTEFIQFFKHIYFTQLTVNTVIAHHSLVHLHSCKVF